MKPFAHLFCSCLFIFRIADSNVGDLASESCHDPLEAALFADPGGAIHVLDVEDSAPDRRAGP